MLEDGIWIQGTQDKVEEWSQKNKAQGGQDWFCMFSNNGTITTLSTLSAQGYRTGTAFQEGGRAVENSLDDSS